MRGKGVFIDTISTQYLLKIKMYYLIYIYIYWFSYLLIRLTEFIKFI